LLLVYIFRGCVRRLITSLTKTKIETKIIIWRHQDQGRNLKSKTATELFRPSFVVICLHIAWVCANVFSRWVMRCQTVLATSRELNNYYTTTSNNYNNNGTIMMTMMMMVMTSLKVGVRSFC